jgi:hypothetical protein
LAAALLAGSPALAADNLIAGKVSVVKPAKVAKFVSKSTTGFPLPVPGSAEDPTLHGAGIRFFDTDIVSGAGDFFRALPAFGWHGLGTPPGAEGYQYRGADVGDSVCKVVLIKAKVIKAVCKGTLVSLATPFVGDVDAILGVPTYTSAAAIRYCAEFGGTEVRNDASVFKHKNALPPTDCPGEPEGCQATTGGFCWFEGEAGQSCDTVCANQGLVYDPATAMYAGSGGTDAHCAQVADDLGGPPFFMSEPSEGVGCAHAVNTLDLTFRATIATTSSAAVSGVTRYCACSEP